MKHGEEVTHEFAEIILMEDPLWKLVKVVENSKGGVAHPAESLNRGPASIPWRWRWALPGGSTTPEVTALISNGSAILARP